MSNSIYVGQPFTIILETGTNLSTATSRRIRIKYLNGTTDDLILDATLVTDSTTAITANVTSAQNTISGAVEIWAWVVFPGDAGVVPGEPYKMMIKPV